MGYYRCFAALCLLPVFVCASLTFAAADELDSVPAPEVVEEEQAPPISEQLPVDDLPAGEGEVIIDDGDSTLHISAETVIVQLDPEVPEEVPAAEEASEPDPLALGPDGFPFYGSCWVQGHTPTLGDVTLFFPINYKDGYIGTDSAGRLFNVSNNTWSGVMYVNSGTSYSVSFGAFALPTYRVYSGSSWQTVTLYLTPAESNIVFPSGPSPTFSVSDLLPYLALLLLGGIFICSMRRS